MATTVLGWGDILKIVLASGVVAAVIGWLKDWHFKKRDRAREAKFAAIGVISKLDLYSIQSRQNVRDYYDVTAGMNPHEHYRDWPTCSYPELVVDEDTLRQLDAEHASDLLSFAAEKALVRDHLYAIHEASFDPTEVDGHRAVIVGYFGYEAYLLASKLRESFGLPLFGRLWGIEDDFPDLLHYWQETKKEVAKRSGPRSESEE